MKITSIKIKNFRSIVEETLSCPVNNVWTLLGQNNAGKSSIFQAFRAFYGEYSITEEDFCRSSNDLPIEITLEFVLDEDEFSQLPEYYKLPDNKLKVVSRFTKQKTKGEWHGFELKDGVVTEKEEEFFGQKNVVIGKLGEVIYVPAVKELSEELKKTKSSIFTKLVSRILSETLTSLPSWDGLVKHAQEFANDLRSPVKDSAGEVKSVHEIENLLGMMLSSWQLKPQILVSPPTPEDIILSGAQLRLLGHDTGEEENPLTLGSGAQRSIVNSLILLWAQVQSKKAKVDKKKFNGQLTLLLYEEPEALLHYDQIRKLSKYLEDIAAATTSQVIICTHSPELVSTRRSALPSITRLVKDKGKTKLFKPQQTFLDDLEANKGDFDFTLWLNPDRNTMFFVDKVILVEGTSDKAFFNYLIQEKGITSNVYVVDCGGKSNIFRFMQLCSEFGIKHAVMFDRDGDKSEWHKEQNKKIIDNKNSYTEEIKELSSCLEEYLGFDEALNFDKAINMVRQLKNGKLKQKHQDEFILFLEN